ncbi:polysaccharide deacetylase family protein (plasmid) [Halorientalis pallida]|uniref:polysaccharide deacetylase family protein n=1 Tax=Halorientalis pallida TaxID=2479928 RepID=UPI003C6F728C
MGTVVLSVDAELGWGFHDFAEPPRDRLTSARRGWRTLLDLCDEYRVPATWAVVGHLFLDECAGHHADHPAPPGWFDHERGDDRMPPSLRFGDGLIDRIEAADADHEIGLHTFSHVELGADGTTARLADAELSAAVEAAREWGLDRRPRSFVFPRNNVGNLQALADHGITCYRGQAPTARADGYGAVGRLLRAAVGTTAPPLVEPRQDSLGLVDLPASLFLFSVEGPARSLAEAVVGDPVAILARRGIDEAAATDGVFHMWLHPNNLVTPRDVARMEAIFEHLARVRARSDLRVRTMGQVAAEARGAGETAREAVATDGSKPE